MEVHMSKFVSRAILVAVVALSAVVAPTATANSGAEVKGVGGGWVGFPPLTSERYVQFNFSAHIGATRNFGHVGFVIEDPLFPLDVKVDVDCVNVYPVPPFRGGAWIAGVATSVSPEPNLYFIATGDRLFFSALDGGEPSGSTPVDSLEGWFDLGDCKLLGPYTPPPDVTHGNIVIETG
jgi:hypothetical protein